MGSTEGVGHDPLHTLKIPLHNTNVKSTSYNVTVLVFSKSLQVNRRAVHQNVLSFYLHCTDTDLLAVFIQHFLFIFDAHGKGIEICIPHLPQMGIFNIKSSLFALG